MKYAVEARVFDSGRIVTKVRPAGEDETGGCIETRSCDVWVDIFGTETEAINFCAEYKKAYENNRKG